MRRAAEAQVWTKLKRKHADSAPQLFYVGDGSSSIDLAAPCTVIGGLNGAGKSRLLKQVVDSLETKAIIIDLHHLCEQALIMLRSRDDFDEMADEVGPLGPTQDRLADLKRIIGRQYDSVDWYALDLVPGDADVARRFQWSGDQPLVPYFRVTYRGFEYTSKEMGLGEFSVHFLFWILEQYSEKEDLVILLDEPDAFLPPVGVAALLLRILNLCLHRGWRAVVTTHAEEMITAAVEANAFTLLRIDQDGRTVALPSSADSSVSNGLIARPSVDHVMFCEDESAWYLAKALLEVADRNLFRTTCLIWGSGNGYLVELSKHLPRPPRPDVYFALVFDGDQREQVAKLSSAWPAVCLPTHEDPDTLFRAIATDPTSLAERIGRPIDEVATFLDTLEGEDPHDWVNRLGERFGRPLVLQSLSSLWAAQNETLAEEFVVGLIDGWKMNG